MQLSCIRIQLTDYPIMDNLKVDPPSQPSTIEGLNFIFIDVITTNSYLLKAKLRFLHLKVLPVNLIVIFSRNGLARATYLYSGEA